MVELMFIVINHGFSGDGLTIKDNSIIYYRKVIKMDIDIIKERIYALLQELGFKKTIINEVALYSYDECYYKITYIERFNSYVIEYANSFDDAVKNVFWDGDWYSISLGDSLIDVLRHDLLSLYINKS